MATPGSGATTEYQHFIPQFLLKNFSRKYRETNSRPKRQPKTRSRKIHLNEQVVNHVNLTAEELAIEIVPVKRVMGMNNMYEDLHQATVKQRRHIEELFGKLESQASPIFRRIVAGFEQEDNGLWLSREERNTLRKFLFLLLYRGAHFRQRFYHDTPADYNSDDAKDLRRYMADRGFQRPVDVWFDNLIAIAECKMDAEGVWMQDIQKRMYPPDARWFCLHTQQSYMALCCPSAEDAEFLQAENSYSIYEGVNSSFANPRTGESMGGPWINFHYFAPVSPKIMIVLRSSLLPVPEEDSDDKVRQERELWKSAAVDRWFGADCQSELADLPIGKARNNYTELVDGQLRLLPRHTIKSDDDRFFFRFFRINNDHVNKINSFMLDNARVSIVFASLKDFTRTLEWFMTATSKTWKNVVGNARERDSKISLLKRLAELLKSLGSQAEPVWEALPTVKSTGTGLRGQRPIDAFRSEYQRLLDDIIKDFDHEAAVSESSPTSFLELYTKLGGTSDSRFYNVEQSRRMLNLRVKLDVWTQTAPDTLREKCRQMLEDMYLCLPPVRVWLYAKQVRAMILGPLGTTGVGVKLGFEISDKPEDVVAAAISQIAKGKILSRHIYNTARNSIQKDRRPGLNVWEPVKARDPEHQAWMNQLVIIRSGPIIQCGISGVEKLAAQELREVLQHGVCPEAQIHSHVFQHAHVVELSVRMRLRARFKKANIPHLEALSGPALQTWFEVTYPTPPVHGVH